MLGHRREGGLGSACSSFGRTEVAGVEDAVDAKLQEGAGLGHGADQGVGIGAGQLPRIAPSGKGGHHDIDLVLALPLVDPRGGLLPGAVGVIGQDDAPTEVTQQREVLLGQGGAARGHCARHPGLKEPDDIGIALAHHHFAPGDDVVLGPVERIERAPLGVDGRFLGVLVLRLGPLGQRLPRSGREDPATEGDRTARGIADGEQHAGPEGILGPAPLVDETQPRVGQNPIRQFQRPAERVPVIGGPAQPETSHHVAVVTAGAQVVPGGAGIRGAQQTLVVPDHGPFQRVEELDPPLAVLAHLGVLMESHAGPVGQQPHGVDEVEMLHLPHEGDGIPRGLAAEAVVEALLGVHAE